MARLASADPLEKFRFQVEIMASATTTVGGATTTGFSTLRAGFKEVQMPKRSTNKILYRDSLAPETHLISPGLSSTEDIILSRGLVGTESFGFYRWASESHQGGPTDAVFNTASLTAPAQLNYKDNMRKDLRITMFDRGGSAARQWMVYNAFVVNFAPGSDLNSTEDSEKAMESLTLAYEDFVEVSVGTTTPIVASTDSEK